MTLPGNRIPNEALPEGGHSVPAEAAELPPVWCRHSVRWSYVAENGGYLCDDPNHSELGPDIAATTVGAIDERCQPTFAHPPNAAQRAATGGSPGGCPLVTCRLHSTT